MFRFTRDPDGLVAVTIHPLSYECLVARTAMRLFPGVVV